MPGVQVGVGYIDIRPDLSGFGRELQTGMTRNVKSAGDDAAKTLKGSFSGAAKGAAAAFGTAFAAVKVKDFLGGAIQSASDLNEQLSKSNAVFDAAGKGIETWAASAADNIGLSKRAALEAASTFGNMFVQLGVGSEQAATLSKSVVELGVDFRSFTNADITEILQAQSAAFRGEYDSLQRFLPLINAATVQQRAMELTGKKNAAQLTAQDKALATYRLMIEGAGDATGDFARTSDSLANQQQSLGAQWENMQGELGEGLMPLMVDFVGLLNDTVIPAMKTLFLSSGADATGWAATLRDAIGDTIGFILGSFGELLRGVANVFGALPGNIGEGLIDNLRGVADGIDGARDKLHASTGELLSWKGATEASSTATGALTGDIKALGGATKDAASVTREHDKATRDAASAQRDLKEAQRDLAQLLKDGAVSEEKVADARERLGDATRSLSHANRELAKAQEAYDEALAAADILGTDTAADALADASDNLADAKDSVADASGRQKDAEKDLKDAQAGDPDYVDKLADAYDRVGDAKDKVSDTAGKMVELTTNTKDATAAVAGLNSELGKLPVVPFNFIGPLQEGQQRAAAPLIGAGPLQEGQQRVAAPAPLAGAGPLQQGQSRVVTNNVTVNVTQPVPDPGLIGKAVAWALD